MMMGNMKFVDHNLTPADYRWKFLQHTDSIAPEVLRSLKSLCPQYHRVFNGYPFTQTLIWWLNGEVEPTSTTEPEILLYLDPANRYKLDSDVDIDRANRQALDDFYSLRNAYLDFLDEFGFSTSDWLRERLFDLLGRLTYRETNLNSLVYAYSHAYSPREGDRFVFEVDGWQIKDDSKDFEKSVRLAFENQLRTYVNQTAKEFQADGYKRSTKPRDIESVKWLVYWTVKRFPKGKIREMMAGEESCDDSTLDKMFQRFKTYGLPVREEKSKATNAG
jgi:hypothetical protein